MSVVVDEAARDALLIEAGKAAKLTDPDLLKLAKRGLAPADAVADLKARYPTGFKVEPVKRYTEMDDAERAAFCKANGLRYDPVRKVAR